eukprot:TRINITY_DN70689_c0_g1_i1.p1 TRINITY_DN70689_c0_g1~~TRINITY_DN70689_c0_g1_i1.p1  ORF type:complete len:234 (+),score=38.14 TRINITY_DN70689_c0_g1_i1:41-742(+)
MVVTQIQRLKRILSVTRRPLREWRERRDGLFPHEKAFPRIRKGWPIMDDTFDIIKSKPTSFRKFRQAPTPPLEVPRLPEEYTPDNFHEMLGKFRFEGKCDIHDLELAEKEVFMAAFSLHLTGWVKVRKSHILGHVQGDTFALSYYRRWLEEKHLSQEAGTLEWVRLWEMNLGLQPPLKYSMLVSHKDHRKYATKKTHMLTQLEKVQGARFEAMSHEKREAEERILEKDCVRNY